MARGVVVTFDLGKGFGFIRSSSYPEDVFVHRTDVDGRVALKSGQRVEFVAEPTERGLRATRVVPGKPGLSPTMSAGALLIAALVASTEGLRRLGLQWFGAWLGAIGLVTWAAYAWDKRRAGLGERRVRESVLLGLALIGGSPAAAVAMVVLRHKTRKPGFLARFAGVVVVQVAVAVAYFRWR